MAADDGGRPRQVLLYSDLLANACIIKDPWRLMAPHCGQKINTTRIIVEDLTIGVRWAGDKITIISAMHWGVFLSHADKTFNLVVM